MAGKRYAALLDERARLQAEYDQIIEPADQAERDFTDDERKEMDSRLARLKTIAGDLAREEQRRQHEREMEAATTVAETRQPAIVGGWDYRPGGPMATPEQAAAAGESRFRSLGEQLGAVARFARGDGLDRRLVQIGAAASGLSEGIQSDGGFLVQHEFASGIMSRMYNQGMVLSRCREQPIGPNANGIKIPAVDETSRANGSRWGGIRAYWAAEAATVTASAPKFRLTELNLQKLMALVYTTDELLADAVALEGWIADTLPLELLFVAEDAIVNGTGAGQPLGILNASALVTQAAEAAQTAMTFNAANASKMRGRTPVSSRLNLAWFLNQDVEQQLPQMTLANQPVFLPDFTRAPGGVLLAHPVIPTEYNATLGAVGDVVLADLRQYVIATKGGIQAAQSMHVRFLYDEMTFRFTYRIDGQPGWNSALTPKNGSNTISPFVALAAR